MALREKNGSSSRMVEDGAAVENRKRTTGPMEMLSASNVTD